MQVVVAAVLMGWLGLSALAQLRPRLLRRLGRYDVVCLVPKWNFFAPVPGTEDLIVLYRDWLIRGPTTNWQELPRRRAIPWLTVVWNPGRRPSKALFDACQQLAIGLEDIRLREQSPQMIRTSIPYILLLNHVASLEPRAGTAKRQFLVMRSTGRDKEHAPRAMFVSEAHRLDPAL